MYKKINDVDDDGDDDNDDDDDDTGFFLVGVIVPSILSVQKPRRNIRVNIQFVRFIKEYNFFAGCT